MRNPGEQITVQLFPHQIAYLRNLLANEPSGKSRAIDTVLQSASLQYDLKMRAFEQFKKD